MNDATVYIDVTTVTQWTRPAVGIIRVEQQLCRWLLDRQASLDGNPIRFVVYQRPLRRFIELSPATVRAHLERIDRYATAPAANTERTRLESFLTRQKKEVLQLVGRLPETWRHPAHRLLRRGKPHAVGLINRLRHVANHWRRRLRQSSVRHAESVDVPIELAAGSVYVSVGLDWDKKDMVDLYRRKRKGDLRMLLFCYDIIPIKLPQLCVHDVSRFFTHYFVDLAWCADRVLCISERSRADLREQLDGLGAPMPDCHVIRLGADLLPGSDGQQPIGEEILRLAPEPYILFVSTIERRKNHEILYRAYTRLAGETDIRLPKLVFVGMPGWGVGELQTDIALDPRVQGLIVQLSHVSDAELAHLYRHARFTVYPSLYEGWGLPVAESLAHGKFCLCSNTSSLPEVGEDWVEYLDPWDLPAWVARLRYFITHPGEVEKRNERIAMGYLPHPWQRTAEEIYRHACELSAPQPPVIEPEGAARRARDSFRIDG